MADLPAIRSALERIGFTQEARNYITNNQGLDEIEEFRILTDEEVENLCKNIRRPGGTIPNPNPAVQGNIPNPGIPVSLKAETNLKLMCYYIRHCDRISRTVYIPGINANSIRALRHLRDEEKQHKDPEELPTIGKDWTKNMESISEWIRQFMGVSGVSLSYVIRENTGVPPEEEDNQADYDSYMDEMIARSPILSTVNIGSHNRYFTTDNAKVWDLLSMLLRESEGWTYIKGCQRSHDGRKAFWLLNDHYLGPNTIDNQAAAAEKALITLTYKGESRRWNFERYVTAHKHQHQIIESLMDQGYIGIDERALKEKSETNEKMTSHQVVIEYPSPMNDSHCPMTELAESLRCDVFLSHVVKHYNEWRE